jgi:beta-1,4-mannosyltransferase
MFGCALPVCARRFSCLNELVRDGVNGLSFDTADELSAQIVGLFRGFPSSTPQLDLFRTALGAFREDGWEKNWAEVAAPVFA